MVTNVYIIIVTFVIKGLTMKERLIQLLDLEQLSPSKFADLIGVQRSSISHIISGRNKPSFDFLQKTLRAFPGLNASWLLMGEGTMYEQMGRRASGNLFDSPEPMEDAIQEHVPENQPEEAPISPSEVPKSGTPMPGIDAHLTAEQTDREEISPKDPDIKPSGKEKRQIVQVMVIYDDDTFRTFMAAH